MAGYDTLFLVVTSGIACKFENFSSKVLQHGGEVNCCVFSLAQCLKVTTGMRTRCTGTNTLSVVATLQETVNTADRELKAGL